VSDAVLRKFLDMSGGGVPPAALRELRSQLSASQQGALALQEQLQAALSDSQHYQQLWLDTQAVLQGQLDDMTHQRDLLQEQLAALQDLGLQQQLDLARAQLETWLDRAVYWRRYVDELIEHHAQDRHGVSTVSEIAVPGDADRVVIPLQEVALPNPITALTPGNPNHSIKYEFDTSLYSATIRPNLTGFVSVNETFSISFRRWSAISGSHYWSTSPYGRLGYSVFDL